MAARVLRAVGLAWAVLWVCVVLSGCARSENLRADGSGDAEKGANVIVRSGCGSCHEIPGIQNADGLVGPPLDHFSKRASIAGLTPNTPESLVHWLRFPQSVSPGGAMPDMGLNEEQARNAAAYLETLR
ncbi:MAG TPA: c-type cytochrome [Rhizomicrobium sp.]|nr:c-type cytochrome [Rhizomicrobium sp.]